MNYDSAWKEILENLLEEFMFFFFPKIHQDIDFSKGYKFLDKELQKITKGSKTGRRIVDKLVEVYLKDGSKKWLLIHIEIQGYEQKGFPKRMFVYHYRIIDKCDHETVSLALLTDDNPDYRPNEYRHERWGFELICRYPLVKIIDYRERLPELEASSEPIAIVVSAYLRALEAGKDVQRKYRWKMHFIKELYRRGMNRKTILAIYKFIDWIIDLPKELDDKIAQEIESIEEKKTMAVLTSIERYGIKKGRKEGRKEGLAKGLAKGLEKGVNAAHKGIANILFLKFGEQGRLLVMRANKINNLPALDELIDKLMQAENVREAEKIFDDIETQGNGKR